MFNSISGVVPAIFALALGLISCSSDKSSTTPDSFKLAAPILTLPGDNDSPARTVSYENAGVDPIPAEARLLFLSLEGMDFSENPIRFEVSTSCTDGHLEAHGSSHLQNQPAISFLSLLPTSMLAEPNEPGSYWTCGFQFEVSDKYGSTYEFSLSQIRIAEPQTSSSGILPTQMSTANGATRRMDNDMMLETADFHNFGGLFAANTKVSLVCETFSSELQVFAGQNWNFSDSVEKAVSASQERPEPDPRWQKPWQKCRVAFRLSDLAQTTFVGPYLEVHFSGPQAQAQVELIFAPAPFNRATGFDLFQITIENPNPVPMSFQLMGSSHLSLRLNYSLAAIGETPKNLFSDIAVMAQLEGPPALVRTDDQLIFTVSARNKATLHLFLIRSSDCQTHFPVEINQFNIFNNFQLLGNLALIQLANPVFQAGDPESALGAQTLSGVPLLGWTSTDTTFADRLRCVP